METTTEIISRSALPSPEDGSIRSAKCARHLGKRSSRQAKARKTLGTKPSFSSPWSKMARVSGASEARWAIGNHEMRSSMQRRVTTGGEKGTHVPLLALRAFARLVFRQLRPVY